MVPRVCILLLHLIFSLQLATTVDAQNVCTPPPCVRASVRLSSNATSIRDPPYICRDEGVTFFCDVFSGVSLQWVFEPDVCRNLPIRYTSANSEGDPGTRGSIQSQLTSVIRAPPFSNFSSNLTFTPNASVNSVTVQCGDQLSSCSNTEAESTISITGAPEVTQGMLQYSFISGQEICPNVSAAIQITQVVGIGLTYELTVSSSDGCVLQECPMLVSPVERLLNIILTDDIEYSATLVVSNDCGSDSTTVSIQPEVCRVVPTDPPSTGVGAIVGGVLPLLVIIITASLVVCIKCAGRKIKTKEQQLQEVKVEMETKEQQLQKEKEEIKGKDQQLQQLQTVQVEYGGALKEMQEEIKTKDQQLQVKDCQIKLLELQEDHQKRPQELQDMAGESNDVQDILKQEIIDAIEKGEESIVQQWIDKEGEKANEYRGGTDSHGCFIVANGTALHWAVYYGQPKIVKLLMGPGTYQKAKSDSTLLHWACQCKIHNEEVLQLLLRNANTKQLINKVDNERRTPLHYACLSKNKEHVRELLKAGAYPYARDIYNSTPMVPVSWLLDFFNELSGLKDSQESTAEKPSLHVAAALGDMKTVKILVGEVDVNTKDKNDNTPMLLAIGQGNNDVVKYLIGKGTDISIQDKDQRTPLHVAAEEDNIDLVMFLVENGAGVNAKDCYGWTPLHIAAGEGYQDAVKYLVESNADINAEDIDNITPMKMAVRQGHVGIMHYLQSKTAHSQH